MIDTANLQSLLDDYTAFDDTEEGYLAETKALLRDYPDGAAFSRDTVIGHITASALVLNQTFDKTLLLHHAKLNRWFQPGGHVEPVDATLETACLREATEETGIAGIRPHNHHIFDIDIHTIPARPAKNEPEHKHFDIRMLLIAPTEDFAINDESTDVKWLSAEEANALTGPSVRRMIKKWELLRQAR